MQNMRDDNFIFSRIYLRKRKGAWRLMAARRKLNLIAHANFRCTEEGRPPNGRRFRHRDTAPVGWVYN